MKHTVPQELLMLNRWQEAGAVVEMALLDPHGCSFFVDWGASARSTVADLRASTDFGATPARFRELVEVLRRNSPEFSTFWAMHDVQPKAYETKELLHYERGLLTIDFLAFDVSSAPGHQLLVHRERPANGS